MSFRVFAHFLNLIFRQAAACGDGDLLFLACAEVFRAHVQNAVGIDVKRHFDLRHAARRRRNVGQMEFADRLVVTSQRTLTLQHVDFHAGLIVRSGGENFRFAGGDCRVALNQLGEDAAKRFDAQ